MRIYFFFFFSSRRRHTRLQGDWSSDVCSSDLAQSLPVRRVEPDYKEDLFYREDWLGEPWRTPDPVVLIHGNDESSVEWYAWVPRMAQEYRLIRPDLPGLGHSSVP